MSKEVFATIGCQLDNTDSVIHRSEEAIFHVSGNADYATPNPTIITVQTAHDNAATARTAWGNGTGSENDKLTFYAAIKILFDFLTTLCAYVNTTTPHDEVAIGSSGFPLSADPHGLPVMEAPQNFHQFTARNIGQDRAKLKCKHPANAMPKQRIYYKYFRSLTPVFANATVIGEETKTTHTDVPAVTVPTTFYYWVTALTPAGESTPSDVLKITVIPLTV